MIWVWAASLVVLATACSGTAGEEPAIPGLDPGDELPLVESEPSPGNDGLVWVRSYEVGDLPQVDVGHASAQLLEDAHREDGDPEDFFCHGSGGSVGCDVEDPEHPAVTGLTFGSPEVEAWSWAFVPVGTAAVRFTDEGGRVTWQRPRDRLVIFPGDPGDADGVCACRFDALDEEGAVIASVDLSTSSYIEP